MSYLALADGTVWHGESVGAEGHALGEAVFTTGMSGYQESVTDPSFEDQLICFTAPMVGNYGVAEERSESARTHARAVLMREARGPEWTDWLREHGVVALTGIDTRSLVLHLREAGAMSAVAVADESLTVEDALSLVAATPSMSGRALCAAVSTTEPYVFRESGKARIAVVDYGAGSGESRRTKEEMDSGVPSTALVADICKVSKPAFWATFLFKLIRKLEPSSCVELGSCVGISAAYQATALRLNGKGRLQTLEGSPEVARLAQETLVSLQLPAASVITGPFHKTFRDVLASAQPIDFFFNDGHHDHDAVMRYFEESLPHLSREAVMVFDDISWSPGMRKAWTEIEADKRVIASVDLQVIGVAVIGKSDMPREKFRIVLPGK